MGIIPLLVASITSWLLVFFIASTYIRWHGTSGVHFIIVHYVVNIFVVGLVFWFYYHFARTYSPFITMAIAMTTICVLEFVFWGFIYKGQIQLLNFTHFIVPMFLVASIIYIIGIIYQN